MTQKNYTIAIIYIFSNEIKKLYYERLYDYSCCRSCRRSISRVCKERSKDSVIPAAPAND